MSGSPTFKLPDHAPPTFLQKQTTSTTWKFYLKKKNKPLNCVETLFSTSKNLQKPKTKKQHIPKNFKKKQRRQGRQGHVMGMQISHGQQHLLRRFRCISFCIGSRAGEAWRDHRQRFDDGWCVCNMYNYIPKTDPCMEYLPTFTIHFSQMYGTGMFTYI